MFGPDKCGEDYKLHFIFRHNNPKTGEYEEKHAKKPDADLRTYYTDKKTHLYTLGETHMHVHTHTHSHRLKLPVTDWWVVSPQWWTQTTRLRFWWIRRWWTAGVCCLTWPPLWTPLLRSKTPTTTNLKTGTRDQRSRTPPLPSLTTGQYTLLITMETTLINTSVCVIDTMSYYWFILLVVIIPLWSLMMDNSHVNVTDFFFVS